MLVLADVATLRHARKAAEAGADGMVLLKAEVGGQAGHATPFAFVSAAQAFYDGIIVLAGGMANGRAVLAATALGCDLAYMGTKFVAAHESIASDDYWHMLTSSTMDDVMLTRAFTGLDTSMLRPSILQAGLDVSRLDEQVSATGADAMYGAGGGGPGPKRWQDVYSAGNSWPPGRSWRGRPGRRLRPAAARGPAAGRTARRCQGRCRRGRRRSCAGGWLS